MFCPKCGIENLADQKFCRGCGHALAAHRAALEGRYEEAVERVKSGATVLGISAAGLILISLMALGVWLSQNDAGAFFTLIPVLAFMIPATVIGIVRLTRAYRVLSHTDRSNKALQQPGMTTVHLTAGATTDSLAMPAPPASVTEHTTLNLESPEPNPDQTRTSGEVDSPSRAS